MFSFPQNFPRRVIYNGQHICLKPCTLAWPIWALLFQSMPCHRSKTSNMRTVFLTVYSEACDGDPATLPAAVAELFDCVGGWGLRWLWVKCNKCWSFLLLEFGRNNEILCTAKAYMITLHHANWVKIGASYTPVWLIYQNFFGETCKKWDVQFIQRCDLESGK